MMTREERMIGWFQDRWSGYNVSLNRVWMTVADKEGLLITGKYSLGVYSADWKDTIYCESDHNLSLLIDQAHQALKAHELATADPAPVSE